MNRVITCIATAIMALSTPAHAMAPISNTHISVITSALAQCKGGWIELGARGHISPADLNNRLDLLSQTSAALDADASKDIYEIAKGLLAPSMGNQERMLDGKPMLQCPSHPVEGVALMEYLVGDTLNSLRGPTNALEWLGAAYKSGAAGVNDLAKARYYFLRFHIHSGPWQQASRWSDGIDDDFLNNVQRAGLRPYLDELAKRGGGPARIALAEAVLSTDPLAARRWLRYPDWRTLNRLLELEDQKRVPVFADNEDIAFWAEAALTIGGYHRYAARMMSAVKVVNGGAIPTSSERPVIASLRPHLDLTILSTASATLGPIPVRALVNPQGRVIYIEPCGDAPAQSIPVFNRVAQLMAAKLYNTRDTKSLPQFPLVKANGRSVYGWVILPAVHFFKTAEGKVQADFVTVPTEQCAYSATADAVPPPTASWAPASHPITAGPQATHILSLRQPARKWINHDA